MTEALLITIALVLFGLALAGKIRGENRRLAALTPDEGKILRRNTASLPYLVVTATWIACTFYFYSLTFSDDPQPQYLRDVQLFSVCASLLLIFIQPEGPVRWTPVGMSGPRAILRHPFRRTRIGWQEITRVTCRRRFGRASAWTVEATDGRRISFDITFAGYETALAAIRTHRPDIDPYVQAS